MIKINHGQIYMQKRIISDRNVNAKLHFKKSRKYSVSIEVLYDRRPDSYIVNRNYVLS